MATLGIRQFTLQPFETFRSPNNCVEVEILELLAFLKKTTQEDDSSFKRL